MLPHYSPFKVAETFTILGGAVPGRIDLGLGRAAGTDPMTTSRCSATAARPRPTTSPSSSGSCSATSRTRFPTTIRSAARRDAAGTPSYRPWLLGSSLQSAIWAGSSGCRTRSRTSSTRVVPRSLPSTGNVSPAERRLPRTAVAAWILCAATTRRRRARVLEPDDDGAASARTADPGAAAGEGARVSRARGQDGRGAVPGAARRSSARRRRSARASRSLRSSTAPKR